MIAESLTLVCALLFQSVDTMGSPAASIESSLNRIHVLQSRLGNDEGGPVERRLDRLEGFLHKAAAEGRLPPTLDRQLQSAERLVECWRRLRRGDLAAAAEAGKALLKDFPDDADALDLIGVVQFRRRAKDPDPAAMLTRSYELRRNKYGDTHPDVALSLAHIGEYIHGTGNPGEAIRSLTRALRVIDETMGPRDREALHVMNALARIYLRADSIPGYRGVDPSHIDGLDALSDRFMDVQAFDTAQALLLLASKTAWLTDSGAAIGMSDVLPRLMSLLANQGRIRAAEQLYEEWLNLLAAHPAKPSLPMARHFHGMGNGYRSIGDDTQAVEMYKQAILFFTAVRGEGHPDMTPSLMETSKIYEKRSQFKDALSCYERALRCRKKLRPDHPDQAESLWLMGKAHCSLGEYEAAEACHQEAIRLVERMLGRRSSLLMAPLNGLATVYARQINPDSAIPLLRRALDICEKTQGPNHPSVFEIAASLGNSFYVKGDFPNARTAYERAYSLQKSNPGLGARLEGIQLCNLAQTCMVEGRFQAAVGVLRDALDPHQATLDPGSTALAHLMLGRVYSALSRREEARIQFRLARDLCVKFPDIPRQLRDAAEESIRQADKPLPTRTPPNPPADFVGPVIPPTRTK